MTNPSKIKGSVAERAIVTFLRTAGFPHAERRLAGATKDRGDIAGIPGVVIESKAGTRTDLAAWVDEATIERDNDHATMGVVWHRRRGTASPAGWFVTMDGQTFVNILAELGYGDGTRAAAESEVS